MSSALVSNRRPHQYSISSDSESADSLNSCLKKQNSPRTKSGMRVCFTDDVDATYEAKIAMKELLKLKADVYALNSPASLKLYYQTIAAEHVVIMGITNLENTSNMAIKQHISQAVDTYQKYVDLSKLALKIAIYDHKARNTTNINHQIRYERKFKLTKNKMSQLAQNDREIMYYLANIKPTTPHQRCATYVPSEKRHEFLPTRCEILTY